MHIHPQFQPTLITTTHRLLILTNSLTILLVMSLLEAPNRSIVNHVVQYLNMNFLHKMEYQLFRTTIRVYLNHISVSQINR